MKYYIILVLFLLSNKTEAQEIEMREESDKMVALLTSTIPLQIEPNFLSTNVVLLIPKDTLISSEYVFSFFYKSPDEIKMDSKSEVEIKFWDGDLFSFPYFNQIERHVLKDSIQCFQTIISSDCIKKMKEMPVTEFTFITPLYNHKIIIEDKAKAILPYFTKYIFEKQEEESKILFPKRRD